MSPAVRAWTAAGGRDARAEGRQSRRGESRSVVLTIFAANLILGAFMLLTADIGTEHGLPFAVYLRAPFGIYGTHPPRPRARPVAAMWFGIQTYLGAIALNGIGSYFLGFDNWFVWYMLFAVVQVVNTAAGIKAVESSPSLAAPAIIAISVWMYFTLDGIAETKGAEHLELPRVRRHVAPRALRRQPRLLVDDGDRYPEPHPLRQDRARRPRLSSPGTAGSSPASSSRCH